MAEKLGPKGEKQVDRATAQQWAQGARGKKELASWLGSKGWNGKRKGSGKAKPRLPSALLRDHLGASTTLPRAVRPLDTWLRGIVAEHERSPL
ncbi:MAG: hypothetical protein ACRCY9_07945 [Phycicoccus sp.]